MPEMTQEQRRAAYALQCINAIKAGSYGRYANEIEGFPAAVLMNGLGQAVATLCANFPKEDEGKEKKEKQDPWAKLIYEHLQGWLCHKEPEVSAVPELIEAIVSGSQDDYTLAQAETLALLVWLKKFSQAYLKKEKGDRE